MTAARLSVLLPHRLGLLTYVAQEPYAPGDVVAVPLGARTVVGVVWDDAPDETLDAARLKPIKGRASRVRLTDELRAFVDFLARYTMTERGAVLKMVLRNGEGLADAPPQTALALTGTEPERWTPARTAVRDALAAGPLARRELAALSGASPAVITGLIKAGVIAEVAVSEPERPRPTEVPPELSPDQAEAVGALRETGFGVTLLEGVTGSGKTEVYFEAVAAALEAGRQALVLMPEIALTPMVTARLTRRFGEAPEEWHSERTPAARVALWRAAATGEARVVVGARSALFLPFSNLGVIVVDEEHDPSFKQEDGVIYSARDMAVARARAAGIPVVLASATPSVETRINADLGRYRRVVLPSRHSGTSLPTIQAVDLRRAAPPRGEWLSPPVRRAVTEALERGEQALLFLNRRGYAPLTVCRGCGHRFHCPNCAASLVDHRFRARLVCHHCGHEEARPTSCPQCGATDTLVPCGPGVERVEEEARALWPAARCEVLSSDLGGGPKALAEALERVEKGERDIIVGTQLVAKGFTFPRLQFVAVVDADLGLENGDPRAAERTFQLLTQVTGRAGRVHSGGRALLQTHAPDHPVIRAMVSGDGEAFYQEETDARRDGGLPPFQRLASVIVSAPDRAEAHAHAVALARTAPMDGVEVLGPAEAPLAVLRGRHRFRLLVRAPRTTPLQSIMAAWLDQVPVEGAVRRSVDIDPQSFL
ncbi:primosomal protein N' [Acuticoccus sediminis]|uniref:Replication restart protein PriA n=1 Tax=Acuticoccus sediminis TaxID=2184697 RepID=A0A8B2NUK3_9HYPH|nr:primosomal protein N' [Acuticoccus sediminis]RAI03867.1 primosomal protein N' [Acuticoccus sediminis]